MSLKIIYADFGKTRYMFSNMLWVTGAVFNLFAPRSLVE